MIDLLDLFAFFVLAVLAATAVVVVVVLGSLPGAIARKRGHPQAAAVNVASWLGMATLGLLWPLALIWAFMHPSSAAGAATDPRPTEHDDLHLLQARVNALERALHDLQAAPEKRA